MVLTNADFGGAEDKLTAKLAQIVVPKSAQAETGEASRTEQAKAILEALVAGSFDPASFTENARYYFTDEVRGDFRQSLSELGALTKFEPTRPPRLRGGYVNRAFRATFEKRTVTLSTYAEPGAEGRWEQFLVMP